MLRRRGDEAYDRLEHRPNTSAHRSATMHHGAVERVEEQSHTEMTIKTHAEEAVPSTAYIDIEVNVNYIKEEPGLADLVKSEPGSSTSKQEVEVDWRAASVEHGAGERVEELSRTETPIKTDVEEAVQSTAYVDIVQDTSALIKQESTIHNDNINRIPCGGVKQETIEAECGDATKPQDVTMTDSVMRRALKSFQLKLGDRLESICRVQSASLDTSRRVKSRRANKRQQADLEPGVYVCDYCQKTFTSKTTIIYHIVRLHTRGAYKCGQCDKRFKRENYLKAHVANVHTTSRQACHVCGKNLKKSQLSQHIRNMHVLKDLHGQQSTAYHPRIYICDNCQKRFASRSAMIYHITRVHASGAYKCSQCDKSFKCEGYLMGHTAYMHARMKACTVCGESMRAQYLRQHMRKMHSFKKLECRLCGETMNSKQYLQHLNDRHSQQFTESHKQSTCSNCGKKFRLKWHCEQHEKSGICKRATGSHPCKSCGRSFKSTWHRHKYGESGRCIRATAGNNGAGASASGQQRNVVVVKEDPADGELHLGPSVFQHMDCNYQPYKEEPQRD